MAFDVGVLELPWRPLEGCGETAGVTEGAAADVDGLAVGFLFEVDEGDKTARGLLDVEGDCGTLEVRFAVDGARVFVHLDDWDVIRVSQSDELVVKLLDEAASMH